MLQRRLILIGLAVWSGMLVGGCANPAAAVQFSPEFRTKTKMVVAVLPFEQPEPGPDHEETLWMRISTKGAGNLVSDMFTTELMRVPGFRLVERSQIQKILNEQDLTLSQLMTRKSAQEIGHLLGVDAVVMGNVSEFWCGTTAVPGTGSCRFTYSMRMVDTKTGIVLVSSSVNSSFGGGMMDVSARCQESVHAIIDKISDEKKLRSP